MSIETVAVDLVTRFKVSGVTVRLFGGIAFTLNAYWERSLKQHRPVKDIDLVVEDHDMRNAIRLFVTFGGALTGGGMLFSEGRLVRGVLAGARVDIYSDPLQLNQRLRFGCRLTILEQTLSSADLLATKLQIHERTEKDVYDIITLLSSCDISTAEKTGALNFQRIVQLCAKWDFYWATMCSLKAARQALELSRFAAVRKEVERRIQLLCSLINEEPKGWTWKARHRIGTRVRWFNIVDP